MEEELVNWSFKKDKKEKNFKGQKDKEDKKDKRTKGQKDKRTKKDKKNKKKQIEISTLVYNCNALPFLELEICFFIPEKTLERGFFSFQIPEMCFSIRRTFNVAKTSGK